ncbi:hypothetical protein Halar_3208 [halophilic archaeon DL31]|jgi:hypothetical protein|nr:hypothetical protein Halar_3208 [halophilic archaeon DL31]
MADDNIWIVTSEYVDNNFSGDVTGTVAEYFEDVYGSSYTIDEFQGISIPSNRKDSVYDVQTWWEDQSFTNSDKNLLLISRGEVGYGGYGFPGTHAATMAVKDSITTIAGPNQDADLIGDSPTVGFSAPQQVAACLHEIGHLYDCDHKDGYADNHRSLNFTSPMLATYADDYSGDTSNCGKGIEHNDFNENRFVQGYMQCAVTAGTFPHDPDKIYLASEVNSL